MRYTDSSKDAATTDDHSIVAVPTSRGRLLSGGMRATALLLATVLALLLSGPPASAATCAQPLQWGRHPDGTPYTNGQIPLSAMSPLSWGQSRHRVYPPGAADLERLNIAYRARFGVNIAITDSYRSFAEQVRTKEAKGSLAAQPGCSNHGWARALDLGGGIQSFGTTQYNWMRDNAPAFGWVAPAWARPGGSKPEPWHWEYPGGSGSNTAPDPGDVATVPTRMDFDNDGNVDLVGRKVDGSLWYYPGKDNGTFGDAVLIGEGWNIFNAIVGAGDVTGDGKSDLVGRKTDGSLWYYPGNGNGTFGAAGLIGVGWNIFDMIVGAGDVTGDGKSDLVGRKTDGSLWYYPGNGNGTFGGAGLIGTGWNIFDTLVGADVNSDGKSDLVGRKTDGSLWYYPGNGNGTFGGAGLIGTGWNIFNTIIAGDVNGDGRADLIGRKTDGSLWYYPGNDTGTFGGAGLIGVGWNIFTPLL